MFLKFNPKVDTYIHTFKVYILTLKRLYENLGHVTLRRYS